ncbi:ABC transporter substrate-binding protein [Occultella kanbiaonis]|uniref:ABC transporter substrate-binding protein n=1 Tax=Occultella kanbiaonis TaxID=2675754 RepID=UPI0013D49232|nr:ABC transporter substrate-binding protein [Occultella kanbiaonis]
MTTTFSRRTMLAGMGGATFAMFAAGCSTEGDGGEGGGGANGGILVIGTGVAASNQFPQNFNRYGGGDTAPGLDQVYETLFRISSKDGGQLIPVLAEKVEHTDDGMNATYTLRQGVTWSDGEPFTSRDVLYTLGTIYGEPNPEPAEDEFVWLAAPIETPDEHTVIVHYNSDQRQQEVNLALYYPIVPAHVFQEGDELAFPEDTMSEPVGTGPMKLMNFGSQLVQYEARDDYWGGTSPVTQIDYVPAGQAGNIETQITQGKVDMSEGGAPGVVTGFATVAETNAYAYIADGSSRGVVFQVQNTERPMTDVNLRKALRGSIDFDAVAGAAGIGYSIPNVAGVDPIMNESLQQPEFNEPIAMDLDRAKADLAASAWTINANGNLEKDGVEHPLAIQVQNDNPTDMVTVPIVVAQWKENLGLTVAFDPKPKDVMDGILQTGDFDLVVTGLNYPGTPWTNYTMYDQPVTAPGDEGTNGNWGRWQWSEETAASMAILVSTLNTPETQDLIAEGVQGVQAAIAEESPFIPYQGGGVGMQSTSINWAALPDQAGVDYFVRVGGTGNLTQMLLDLEPA